jgi:hypothetical protein
VLDDARGVGQVGVGDRVRGGYELLGLESLVDDGGREIGVLDRQAGAVLAAPHAHGEAGHAGAGAVLRQEQKAALRVHDPHHRVQDPGEDLVELQAGVDGLHQREQELLVLDPGELDLGIGQALGAALHVAQAHVAQGQLAPRGQGGLLHLGGVHVDAVQAVAVLGGELALLVVQPGMGLRDRGLGQHEIVLVGAPHRVAARTEEEHALRQPARDHDQGGDGEDDVAGDTSHRVGRIGGRAARAIHGSEMMFEASPAVKRWRAVITRSGG